VDNLQAESKQALDDSGVSTQTCSSTAVSVMSSSSKHRAGSQHRKTTSTVKPVHVRKKSFSTRYIKSSLKARSRTWTPPPQLGDKLPVEIIFTCSTVDIMWQVGWLESLS